MYLLIKWCSDRAIAVSQNRRPLACISVSRVTTCYKQRFRMRSCGAGVVQPCIAWYSRVLGTVGMRTHVCTHTHVHAPSVSPAASIAGTPLVQCFTTQIRTFRSEATLQSTTNSVTDRVDMRTRTHTHTSTSSSRQASGKYSNENRKNNMGNTSSSHMNSSTTRTAAAGKTDNADNANNERNAVRSGIRVALRIAQTGMCSRRQAEAWIAAGRVRVNGKVLDSPAVNVTSNDSVAVDGRVLTQARRPVELYLLHKLRGEIVTRSDPEGRQTVFQRVEAMGLPTGLLSVGRLDYNTEGLLLLTTSSELSRYLEHPANAVERTYRVRVFGRGVENAVKALQRGAFVDGVQYRPARVAIASQHRAPLLEDSDADAAESTTPARGVVSGSKDLERADDADSAASRPSAQAGGKAARDQTRGSAADDRLATAARGDDELPGREKVKTWLEITLQEGKNREIRRILESFGLIINRLIRVQYGQFKLAGLPVGSARKVAVPRQLLHAMREFAEQGPPVRAEHAQATMGRRQAYYARKLERK